MSDLNLPTAFHCRLSFSNPEDEGAVSFSEVSGLAAEIQTESILESEKNCYKHRVPASSKYSNLILKRGLAHNKSAFIQWCAQTLETDKTESIKPKTILVEL